MQVTISIKDVYGRPTAYPACKVSEGLAAIAGTKTLTVNTLRVALNMGFEFQLKVTVGGLSAFMPMDRAVLAQLS